MDTKLIELRETNSNFKKSNGKFNIDLKKHITLNNGDELNIRNIFIDSKKESNTILVPNDVELKMVVSRGWTFNSDFLIAKGVDDNTVVETEKLICLLNDTDGGYQVENNSDVKDVRYLPEVLRGDTLTYYPVKLNQSATGDMKELTSIQISPQDSNIPFFGGFYQVFQYTNSGGGISHGSFYIPKFNSSELLVSINVNTNPDFAPLIYNSTQPITPISPSNDELKKSQYNLKYVSFSGNTLSTNKVMELVEQTITINIEAGNYQPSILAQKINLQINNLNQKINSKNVLDSISYVDSSGKSIYINQDNSIYGTADNVPQGTPNFIFQDKIATSRLDYFHMISEDDSDSLLRVGVNAYDSSGNLSAACRKCMAGASVMEIVFDPDTQTFKITNLHTPYYITETSGGATSSEIGVKIANYDITTGRIITSNSKRADLKILSLSSNDGGNFWFDKLGFDSSIITNVSSHLKEYDTEQIYSINFNYKGHSDYGTKRTDAYINSSIQLANNLFNPNYLGYVGDGINTPFESVNTDTIQIFGSKTLNDLIVDDAYFKIIINGVPTSNKLYNEKNISLISGIVGKYYSGQSYTNGFSTDGINYIHTGEPITLSSFDIQILNSKDEDPNIGNDNSIIIQVNNMNQK